MPNELNAEIAVLKGWTVERKQALGLDGQPIVWKGQRVYKERWYDPSGQYRSDSPPDYVGTLKGMARLMQELNEYEKTQFGQFLWKWYWCPDRLVYLCVASDAGGTWKHPIFKSPKDNPGDCVGRAWIAIFGKKAVDARTTN